MKSTKSIFAAISFLFFGTGVVVCTLAPSNKMETSIITPDFLFCFIFIFLIRQPQNTPLPSILFLSILADFLWYRPLGLTTLTIVLGSEFVRWILTSREKMSLFEEFVLVALILFTSTIIQELVKFLTLIPSLALGQLLNYTIFTLLVYLLITIFINVLKRSKIA